MLASDFCKNAFLIFGKDNPKNGEKSKDEIGKGGAGSIPGRACQKSKRDPPDHKRGGKRRLQPHDKSLHSHLQGAGENAGRAVLAGAIACICIKTKKRGKHNELKIL